MKRAYVLGFQPERNISALEPEDCLRETTSPFTVPDGSKDGVVTADIGFIQKTTKPAPSEDSTGAYRWAQVM